MLACTEHWDQYFRDMQGITEINENIVSQKFGAIQYIKVVLILPIKMPRRSWRTDRSILTVTRPYFNIFCHHEDKRKKAVWQHETNNTISDIHRCMELYIYHGAA